MIYDKCENCANFKQYFIKCGIRLIKMDKGHCTRGIKNIQNCNRLSPIAIDMNKSREALEKLLTKTAKTIENIAFVIKNYYSKQ